MIGILALRFAGNNHRASLDDDGLWRCADTVLQNALQVLADPADTNGPQYGPYGFAAVQKAMEQYSGRLLYLRPTDDRSERVY